MVNLGAVARSVLEAHTNREGRRAQREIQSRIADDSPAWDFAGMTPFSLAFADLSPRSDSRPAINLVLPEYAPDRIYAGVKTALAFGRMLATETARPLRVIPLRFGRRVRRSTQELADQDFELAPALDVGQFELSDRDIWIATHWHTAHVLDVAVRLGRVDPARVIYLVQDYEPGFNAWSDEYAIARSTYHAGFRLVVNSSPVADYLSRAENLHVDRSLVFAPHVDLERLERIASSRRRECVTNVLFYARPTKPRNLFKVGMAAMALTARSLGANGERVALHTAGEPHQAAKRLTGTRLTAHGKLAWDDYYELLSKCDVVLSLQYSPHPSHLPLDAVTSGSRSVTNELDSTRSGLSENWAAVEADPSALATAVLNAIDRSQSEGPLSFESETVARLGRPMQDVVSSSARVLL